MARITNRNFLGNSKFELDFWGNALPTAKEQLIKYITVMLDLPKRTKLFGWTPRITVTLTNRDYSTMVDLLMIIIRW